MLTLGTTAQAQLAYYQFNNELVSSDTDPRSAASLLSLTGLTGPVYDGTRGAPAPSLKLSANSIPTSFSVNTSSYLQFTVTADNGYRLNLSSLSFDLLAGSSSPYYVGWQVRSSLDNYAVYIGTGSVLNGTTFTTAAVDLSAAKYDSLQSITFRFYFNDFLGNSSSYLDVDQIRLLGSTVPEPNEWALLAAGSLAAFGLHQRCTHRDRA